MKRMAFLIATGIAEGGCLALISRRSFSELRDQVLCALVEGFGFYRSGDLSGSEFAAFSERRPAPYLGVVVRVWGKSEIGLPVRSTQTGLKVLSSKIYESLEAP